MKNALISFLFAGLMMTAFVSFSDPQNSDKKQNRKSSSDTSTSRRIEHQTNQPKLKKTDTLPIPNPNPTPTPVPVPIPRPDTTLLR